MPDERCPDFPARLTTLLLWLPALAFLVPYGIASANVCPAIGMLPMTLSAAIAVAHLAGRAPRYQLTNVGLEVLAAGLLIGILIPGWVKLAETNMQYTSVGTVLVGAYGTAAMMGSFVIHAFIALRDLRATFRSPAKPKCPHCHGGGYAVVEDHYADTEEHVHDGKKGRITLEEDEPQASGGMDARPSTDDESARLV